MEGGIERTLRHLERLTGDLLDPLGDGPAVLLERQRAEDQQIQRALRKVDALVAIVTPFVLLQVLRCHRLV